MPVSPDLIAEISRHTVDLYRAAEAAILREVTRRLGQGMESPDWAVHRLGALSTVRRAVDQILKLVLKEAAGAIREALSRAYRRGNAEATVDVPARLLPRHPDAARMPGLGMPQTPVIENLAVALVQDIGARHSNVVRDVEDIYRRVIAEAVAVETAGGMTRRQAAQHAYQRLVDKGVTGFVDRSGRRWRLSSYVEMGVRTVTQRAAVQGQTDKQLRLGLLFAIVSDEVQECVLCRPWEGRIVRLDNGPTGAIEVQHATTGKPIMIDVLGTIEEARAAGLQHPNCRHSIRTYLPGVTRRPARPTADPEGDRARQRQREIERNIRRWKERELAALDPDAAKAARAKVRAWQAAMRDHLASNPALRRLTYREQIGAGNIPAGARETVPAPKPPPLPKRQPVRQEPDRVEDLAGLLEVDMDHQVNRSMVRDVFADVMGGDYAGYTVEIDNAGVYDSFGHDGDLLGLIIDGRIYPGDSLDANAVGLFQRGFYRDEEGDLVAVHAYLQLGAEHRGKGFASEFNNHLYDWYRSQGVTRVETHANIDVGGYTWATQGFTFADEESADSVIERLRFMVDLFEETVTSLRDAAEENPGRAADLNAEADLLDRQLAAAAAILDRAEREPFGTRGFPTASEISQCGRTFDIGDGKWIGKSTMLGSDWQGVKWL